MGEAVRVRGRVPSRGRGLVPAAAKASWLPNTPEKIPSFAPALNIATVPLRSPEPRTEQRASSKLAVPGIDRGEQEVEASAALASLKQPRL